jgi:hypothetical protein
MSDPIDETTDGPDIIRAQKVLEQIKTSTSEMDIVLAEQRRLSQTLERVGRRNHFADRFRAILRGQTT